MQIKILLLAAAVFALCSCQDNSIKVIAIRQEQVVQVLVLVPHEKYVCNFVRMKDSTGMLHGEPYSDRFGQLTRISFYELHRRQYPELYAYVTCTRPNLFGGVKAVSMHAQVVTYDEAIKQNPNGWLFELAKALDVSIPHGIDDTTQGDLILNYFLEKLKEQEQLYNPRIRVKASSSCTLKSCPGVSIASECCEKCVDCAKTGKSCRSCSNSGFPSAGSY